MPRPHESPACRCPACLEHDAVAPKYAWPAPGDFQHPDDPTAIFGKALVVHEVYDPPLQSGPMQVHEKAFVSGAVTPEQLARLRAYMRRQYGI